MRPLHRPMFRYGGPIKEGVMSGIREPHAGGGRAALVGNSVYPRTGGREHHNKVLQQIGMKVPALGAHYNKGIANLGKFWDKIKSWAGTTAQVQPITKVTKTPVTKWSKGYHGTVPGGTGYQASGGVQKIWTPHGWVARDPLYKLGSAAWQGKGYLGKPLKWAGKTIATPTGGIGLVYLGGKWLTRDGKEATENEIIEHLNTGGGKSGGVPGGGDQGMKGTGEWFAAQDAKRAEKLRNERIQKYRDIMDIKGMNKEAAANSLIEASRLINESQDFKGDIKSGSLINKIIQGASKAFDKPADTKKAIDTLILKGEIEKDIKADDPSSRIANELNLARIEKLNKELAGNTFSEAKAIMRKAGSKGQAEITDAAKSLKGINYQGTLISKKDFKDVIEAAKNTAKDQGGTLSEEEIIEGFATKFIVGKNAPDGEYVVGDAIISIKDGQVVPGSVRR